MSAEERETLSLGLARGHSSRTMMTVLRRATSNVSREYARNAMSPRYRACTAQTLAVARAREPRRPRTLPDPWLCQYVQTQLAKGCSPEQIAERPAEVATRTVPGHWEGDLIKGARKGSVVCTLVERTTRLVLLARMEGTDARSAREGFTKKLRHVPASLRSTLTYDWGKEKVEHEHLAVRLAIRLCFADPYRPWKCGTNENTNELLRQYLAKRIDLSGYTQRELKTIAHRLNTRPRKCLNFSTPLEVYAHLRHYPIVLVT